MSRQAIVTLVLSLALGAVSGAGTNAVMDAIQQPTTEERIAEFYATENAVHVSPHGLRVKLSKGDTSSFVLVDLRSEEEYKKEHIVSAVNIPAYKDPNTSAYDEVERIVGAFEQLRAAHPGKDIVVYCYSMPCMTGRKIGAMLAEHDIYVKHLNIGWNEWRYYWNLWNHDGETPSRMQDYVMKGAEPGVPKPKELPSPCDKGGFGC